MVGVMRGFEDLRGIWFVTAGLASLLACSVAPVQAHATLWVQWKNSNSCSGTYAQLLAGDNWLEIQDDAFPDNENGGPGSSRNRLTIEGGPQSILIKEGNGEGILGGLCNVGYPDWTREDPGPFIYAACNRDGYVPFRERRSSLCEPDAGMQGFSKVIVHTYGGKDKVDTRNLDLPVEIHGGDENDKIWGGTQQNKLWGDDGSDRIYGGPLSDEIHGDDGSDPAGDGADKLYGGSSGAETKRGVTGPDYIYGDGAGDRIYGGDGDDLLITGGENDSLNQVAGDGQYLCRNRVYGGDGKDAITATSGCALDIIYGQDDPDVIDTAELAFDPPRYGELDYVNCGRPDPPAGQPATPPSAYDNYLADPIPQLGTTFDIVRGNCEVNMLDALS